MSTVHIVLLVLSCGAMAASAAGGPWLRHRSPAGPQLQTMGLVIAAALAIGNAACLLPQAPAWYSVLMIAVTAAGLVWLAVSMANARQSPVRLVASRPVSGSPSLTLIKGSLRPTEPLQRRVVTGEMIHDQGPAGSRNVSSQSVYVAANLPVYLPEQQASRRTGTAAARRRVHTGPRVSPERLAAAYHHPAAGQPDRSRWTMC